MVTNRGAANVPKEPWEGRKSKALSSERGFCSPVMGKIFQTQTTKQISLREAVVSLVGFLGDVFHQKRLFSLQRDSQRC